MEYLGQIIVGTVFVTVGGIIGTGITFLYFDNALRKRCKENLRKYGKSCENMKKSKNAKREVRRHKCKCKPYSRCPDCAERAERVAIFSEKACLEGKAYLDAMLEKYYKSRELHKEV